MRSKGSRFTLGVWGLRVCSIDIAQLFATVRDRPQPFASVRVRSVLPCLWRVLKKRSLLEVSASFHVAGVALRDISTCFIACQNSSCVAGAILSHRFQKTSCIFRGKRSTLETSIVILRDRRSALDESCCVLLANRIVRAASSGNTVQIPWQAWHFVRCAENWRKPRTKHWFWGSKCWGS